MAKKLGYVFIGLAVLVLIDYVVVLTQQAFAAYNSSGFLSSLALVPSIPGASVNGAGLPSINFNFFSPTGVGKDYITQGYGHTAYAYLYINGWHNGIDLAANFGTPVYSPTDGTVLATIDQDAYCPRIAFGKYVAIDDPVNHLVFVLSHFGTFDVSAGQHISKGTLLGTVGPTGLETGPHLLVSIFQEQGFVTTPAHGCGPYPQGHDVDPLNYLGTVYRA